MNTLDTSIEYIKGVGPVKAGILKSELQIYTFADLMSYYPFRYVDKRVINKISEIDNATQEIQLKGYITSLQLLGEGKSMRLEAGFSDETGHISLVWFKGIKWIKDKLKPNTLYIVYGKPSNFLGNYNISHPELETIDEYNEAVKLRFHPVYRTSEKMKASGLNSKNMSKIIDNLFRKIYNEIDENLSEALLLKYNLMPRKNAYYKIHFPVSEQDISESQRRLKFEELFFLQLSVVMSKLKKSSSTKGFVFSKVGELFNTFYSNNISFELTNAQKRVVKEIRNDFRTGKQMNRLLQGDVGSGKTLVALMSMIIAVENGYQACMMAPTEILANQHFKTITKMMSGLPVKIELLTGTTKKKEKNRILEALKSGEVNLIIGTHILIEDYVQFANLGFVVIDEQHRFGVAQRAKMWKKNTIPPHILVMTATPIPRTLAMTVYGDLDYSVIDELPPGRRPIKTIYLSHNDRLKLVFFIKRQIAEGRQIYMVFPLINESPKLELKDLMDGYDRISREFPLPDYQISIVHGQQKPDVQEFEMNRFVKHETQILIATTVIEVGVDVPNATVMVIENAERFGLSQLHQLRGRVGRGGNQSYCILMSGDKVSNEGKKRIATMVSSNDGFAIAEADLKLRGPGDMNGIRQSGVLDLKIADIAQDEQILKAARDEAFALIDADPKLAAPENRCIKTYLDAKVYAQNIWSMIS
ncbi:MAG: ATP-dependent DNA helicase RecG [Bacteroidales bacterium]|nr:ATP-dependent DNA helicase RecG [Bacteroidales bacterium]MDD2205529.1 ATP-dependent DNA helicase RecG [Bacteroidales bacterium]MDD3913711.1 ATP-dependent DNA helicase RecG [Bacteroidales bacterium]MDD4634641.1 ATP-dependent DNA helicase RecG [Bacteroidales bacterium]